MTALVVRRCWHVLLASTFLVAYLTGNGFGRLHAIAGWCVLAALLLRLGVALAVPTGSDLALWRARRRPWLGWLAALVLSLVLAAGISGLPAEAGEAARELHSRLSDLAMAMVGGHMSLMLLLFAA